MILYFASKEGEVQLIEKSEALENVFPVVRLQSNIKVLEFLVEGEEPTRIPCRVKKKDRYHTVYVGPICFYR